jgi:hypothetical protein
MKPAKIGRPKLAKSEFKGVLIGARFAPDEARQVMDSVKRSGLVKSVWIRNALLCASKTGRV